MKLFTLQISKQNLAKSLSMKSIKLIIAFLIFATSIKAQQVKSCGSDILHSNYLNNHPEMKLELQKNEATLQDYIQSHQFTFRSSEEVLKVPIVIHVMHLGEAEGIGNNISDAQIQSGLQQLNDAYRNTSGLGLDMGIEFALAIQDPNGESTTGIVRVDASGLTGYTDDGISLGTAGIDETLLKAASKWPKDQYYNIWIVSEINGNDGGYGTQGFAYLPGASATYDGTVVQNTAWGDQGTVNGWNDLGTTIIHELGHGLGLYHTWHVQDEAKGDTTANGCPLNTSCSTQGDLCCDTDPHMVSSSNSCDTNLINPCTGVPLGNVVRNYMDYSDQACQVMFSQDQKDRMRGTLNTKRLSLLKSRAFHTPIIGCSNPISAGCSPQTQADGLSNYYAGLGIYEIKGEAYSTSSFANVDGGYLDQTSECAVTAFLMVDSTYELKLTPRGSNNVNTKTWIDFDNDGDFSAVELIFDGDHFSGASDSTSFTIPNTATLNEFIRLRTILDLATPTDACYAPQYGQVEDYNIYLYTPGEITSEIVETSEVHDFQLFPNPAESLITIEFDYSGTNNIQLIVRDLQGRLVSNQTFDNSNKIITQIDVSNFQKGIYNVSIQNNKNIVTQNFVVK